jgi:hypothetical protein
VVVANDDALSFGAINGGGDIGGKPLLVLHVVSVPLIPAEL